MDPSKATPARSCPVRAVMNVLHIVSPQPPGETGGVDLHVADLAAAQLGDGQVRPHVLELGNKGFAEVLAERGVPATTIAFPYRASVIGEVSDAVGRASADVVHTHGYDADLLGIAGWLRRPRPRPALVATVHGLIWTPADNFAKTTANLAALRLAADAVIVTSRQRAEWLQRVFPKDRLRVIANGVQISPTPRRHIFAQQPVLGYVGRLSHEKGTHRVIEVCAALAGRMPGLTCRIIGTGPEENQLRELSNRLGVTDRIQFVGLATDIAAELSRVDVLLLLSDTEGTPRAVIEAMAARVPVVAAEVGGIPDLVRDHIDGFLVAPGEVTAAAAVVQRVLEDPALAERLVTSAFHRYQREFTVEHMRDNVQTVYERAKGKVSGFGSRGRRSHLRSAFGCAPPSSGH